MPDLNPEALDEFLAELFCEIASIVEGAPGVRISVGKKWKEYVERELNDGDPDAGSPEWWKVYRLFYTAEGGWHPDIARSIEAYTGQNPNAAEEAPESQ